MVTREQAKVIAGRAADGAYSYSTYTPTGWIGVATFLASKGFDEAEIEWTLWSKHMRWAADSANRSAYATTANFKNYVASHLVGGLDRLREDACKGLGRETPAPTTTANPTGADLAGNCEGEQIAALIDLAQALANGDNPKALRSKAGALVAEIKARGEA